MPEAMAMTFFSAPAISQPTTSGFVYTRNSSVAKTLLQLVGDVVVANGHHRGRGVARQDLLGQVRPGEHADGVAGQLLG